MAKFNQILMSVVLVCLVERHDVNAAVKSYKASHNYPEKQVFYSFNEGNLVLAVCDKTAQGKNCTIIQEQYPNGKSPRTCNVSLEVYQQNASLSDKIYAMPLGRDNVILFYDEIGNDTFFKVTTVNMDNCEMGGFVLPDPSEEIYDQLRYHNKIVTYDDTFEVFIRNGNANLTSGTKYTETVMTVNSRGFVEKQPTDFMNSDGFAVRNLSPIDVNSTNKSYVYSKELVDQYNLAMRKADGSEKVLATYADEFYTSFHTSIVNNLITLCVKKGQRTGMTCTQYDKEGNAKFKVSFKDDNFKEKVAPRDLYNLPDGGFLIVLSEYAKSGEDVDYATIIDYVVIKVDSEGKKVGSIHLNDLVKADNMIGSKIGVHIWKNGNEEYCAAVMGQGVKQAGHEDEPSDLYVEPTDLSIDVNCFTEGDLAV